MQLAPILFFTYNRPEHTLKSLEALKRNLLSDQSELFFFSDGPRNEADSASVNEVRKIIRSVEGFKQIHIVENDANKGLAANIIEGVTQVINKYGRVIVLEDDLITSSYFLTFMNEALERYENVSEIAHIQGYCYPNLNVPDVFLTKWPGSWGWATWASSWCYFNSDGKALLENILERKLTKTLDFNGKYPYTRMLKRQVDGINNSWAIRWYASLLLMDKLSLNAGKSLVQNIGFDGTGTHSGNKEIYVTNLYDNKLSVDVQAIEESKSARLEIEKYHYKTYSFWAKVKRRLFK